MYVFSNSLSALLPTPVLLGIDSSWLPYFPIQVDSLTLLRYMKYNHGKTCAKVL